MRAHDDEASLQYSFRDVITAKPDSPKLLRELQKHCLEPGKYATHLQRWLTHFSSRQVRKRLGKRLVYREGRGRGGGERET